jgi:hypothetical protein
VQSRLHPTALSRAHVSIAVNTLRTLNHRFFGLRPRALGSALVATGALLLGGGLALGGPGAGISGGVVAVHADSNHGDFWVQNSNSDPKAEDPHLDCTEDITLWGSDINGTTGTFEIDLISPSGSGVAVNGNWAYDLAGTDPQQLATIKESDLVAGAVNAGATADSSLHFKISLPIFPNKHKTFWIDCGTSTTTSSTTTDTSSQTTTSSSTTTSTTDSSSTTTDSSTATSDPTTTSSSTTDHSTTQTSTDSSTTSSTTEHTTTSSSTNTSTGGVGGVGSTTSSSTTSSSNGGTPPGTGATTTSTAGAPTSTGSHDPIAASVPEHQLSVPESGANVPFVPGFLLLLAGGGLLAADVRRGRRQAQDG